MIDTKIELEKKIIRLEAELEGKKEMVSLLKDILQKTLNENKLNTSYPIYTSGLTAQYDNGLKFTNTICSNSSTDPFLSINDSVTANRYWAADQKDTIKV